MLSSKDEEGGDIPEADLAGDWDDMEEAWTAYTLMESTKWQFLPYAGGLLDQPEALMRNILRISNIVRAREGNDG